MIPAKRDFLEVELFTMTLMATVQRAYIYRAGSREIERAAVRDSLHAELVRFADQYSNVVSEAKHAQNISSLSDRMSAAHHETLNGGRFRIGSAQKALNLYLKYAWCLGWISMPPHCPFDAVILAKLPKSRHIKWTKLDSLPQYEEIVANAKVAANGTPLAEWEPGLYNAAQPVGQKQRSKSIDR